MLFTVGNNIYAELSQVFLLDLKNTHADSTDFQIKIL